MVFRRFFRDKLRWITWWTIGTGAFTLLSIAFYPAFKKLSEFDELFKDDSLRAMFGGQGGISLVSPEGFLHSQVFAQTLPTLLLIFGIGLGSRAIAGAEGDGTLELLLANPVTRRRVAIERYLTIIVQTLVLGLVTTAVVVAFAPLVQLDGLSMTNVLGACASAICFGIVHATIAFASGAATGKRGLAIATSASVGVGGFVLFGLVSGGVVEPFRFLTPWWWYVSRNTVAVGLAPEAIWAPLAVSAVLVVASVARFERRDLRGGD